MAAPRTQHQHQRQQDSGAMFLKGHSQLRDRADLDTSFFTLKRVHLNLKSKVRVEYV